MGFFKNLGLREVINACGRLTALGASIIDEKVAEAMKQATQEYVNIEELMEFTGKVIAEVTGAEDGCPTCGAAAGVAISIAAVIAKTELPLIEKIPDTEGLKNEIIIQKGHVVNFDSSLTQVIRIGGGKPIEVGHVNKVDREHIERVINEKTAALLFVKSHHTVQKGMLSIEEMLDIAREYELPFIVDAAAEEDFQKYVKMGADIVIYSGTKALEGNTSGFICGKKKWMEACRAQYKGIGRSMKIGKEGMAGLITALRLYGKKTSDVELQIARSKRICELLNELAGLTCTIEKDESGRDIYRAKIAVDENITGMSALELARRLEANDPAIYLRKYYAAQGILYVDPRPLLDRQEEIVVKEIAKIINKEK